METREFSNVYQCINNAKSYSDSTFINVLSYGAVCNGSTDDSSAIQTALNAVGAMNSGTGGTLYFPSAQCNISKCLIVPEFVNLHGEMRGLSGGETTIDQVTNSTCVFQVGGVGLSQNSAIDGFHVIGGSSTIYAPDGVIFLTVSNFKADGPTFAGANLRGFIQQTFWRNVEVAGGQNCITFSTAALDSSAIIRHQEFDKNTFYDLYCHGASKDGVFLYMDTGANGGTGNTNSFTNLVIQNSGHNGIVITGPISDTTIYGWNTEANGLSQSSSKWDITLATATAGSNFILVTSTVGLTIGDTVTVQGAGTTGLDFQSNVTAIFTSSITVGANAITTSSGTELTNALYSDLVLNPVGSAAPTYTTLVNPSIGDEGAPKLYGINNNGGSLSIIGGNSIRPFYDANGTMLVYSDATDFPVRRKNNYIGEPFTYPSVGGTGAPRSQIVSPPGGNLTLGLTDSNKNSSGSFGVVDIRIPATNGSTSSTQVIQFDSGGDITFNENLPAPPPPGFSLCIANSGILGHCTGTVSGTGTCSCTAH